MNIFVLNYNPQQAAQDQCDKHVVKMVLETAQILSTVRAELGHQTTYKPTHAKHPCTIWAMQTAGNYKWLLDHGRALAQEYTHRYGKHHKSEVLFYTELGQNPLDASQDDLLTDFAQAMPEEYRARSAVLAYRRYYLGEKADIASWTNRMPPLWFQLADPLHDLGEATIERVSDPFCEEVATLA